MNIPVAKSEPLSMNEKPFDKGFVIMVSLVAAFGGLLFGFDTAIISGAIPYIKTYFKLNELTLGWAVGSILIGCCAGALTAGITADKYGRKFVLVLCAILFALSGIGAGMSVNITWFVFFRMIGGLGVGGAAMISPMYIAEISPSAWRGRLVSLYQLAIVSGILLAYFSNYLLADTGIDNWRYMFMSQTFPALVFFLMLTLVPETPRWLVKKNRINDALLILVKTVGNTAGKNEIAIMQKSFSKDETSEASGFSKRYFPILTIGVLIAVFQQITGINAVLYYAPMIFKQTGVGLVNSLLQTICIGVVNVIATFLAIGLVDKLGRRRLMLFGSFLMAACLLTVALCFHLNYFKNYIVLMAILVYVGCFGCTLGAVTWVYLSEIFPNRIRAFAMSVATLGLWLADFLVTYTFPILANRLGTSLTVFIYAMCCIISFFYILVKLPETKGKSLEEIEQMIIKQN
ncbi:MAG: MFS transporter [Sphingobacteriaceae bacterium]|nr:MAG: MFS transporter [Sphingobacteriaceae bacterium]